MSNESSSSSTPLNLLQDCIIAGSGATSDNDINMQRKCQQQVRDGESSSSTPFHNFMDILRDRATSSVFTTSSNNSKANAYSNMRQDFNISSKVWGGL